ncbi:hypothetical protein AM586_19520 [Massilia sp. WG5]|nr:hypothetical protein AM586_19520 [Massilia sp. WG5]
MAMTKKGFLWCSVPLCLLVLAATLLVYSRLPATVPAHWNAVGELDRYGPRGWVFTQPLLLAVLTLLWTVLPGVSPERFRVGGFSATWWYCGIVVAALLAYIQAVLLWGVSTGTMPMARALLGGIGAAIVLLGNVLGKVKRNFWLGVRTPWTLASDRVWYATHRLAGKTMVAGGLVALGAAVLDLPFGLGIGAIVLGALAPAAYSLIYYRRLEQP